MRSVKVRQLTFAALFAALAAVLAINPFTFYMPDGSRITFREIPIYLCSFSLGPVMGGLCAFGVSCVGRLAWNIHPVVSDRGGHALALRLAFLAYALLVVAFNGVPLVCVGIQNDHGCLVCDQLVFQADVADEIRPFAFGLEALIDHVLVHLYLRQRPKAFKFRIVGVLFWEVHFAFVSSGRSAPSNPLVL